MDAQMKYGYTIGDQQYYQQELVWGQIEQLKDKLKGFEIRRPDAAGIIEALGGNIVPAIAVVLIPQGQTIQQKTKDIDTLAEELRFALTPATIAQVVTDFFDCNPIPSWLEEITKATGALGGLMTARSSASSASSPEETSPDETRSSGDAPPESPDLTLNTGAESPLSEAP